MTSVCVYQITRRETGACYIGISKDPQKRWSEHLRDAKVRPQGRLHRALAKYGRDAFVWQVLQWFSSVEEAKLAEICLIYVKDAEYNLSIGGDGNWGYVHTDEAKAKLSRARRGKPQPHTGPLNTATKTGVKQSPEHVEKRVSHFRGRPRCREAVAKTVAANTGRKCTPEQCARNSASQQAYQAGRTPEERYQGTARARAALAAKRAAQKAAGQN